MRLVNIKHYFFYQIARHIPTNDLRLKALCNMECVVLGKDIYLAPGIVIIPFGGVAKRNFFLIASFTPFVVVFAKKVKGDLEL